MTKHEEKVGVNSQSDQSEACAENEYTSDRTGATLDRGSTGMDLDRRAGPAGIRLACLSRGAGAHSRAPGDDGLPHTEGAQGKGECYSPATTHAVRRYSLTVVRRMKRSEISWERTSRIQHSTYQSSS